MTTEIGTHHIPAEILGLVATAEQTTVQVWIQNGDIEFRIWLTGKGQHGVIGGSIWGRYNSFYAISDDGTTNTYCSFEQNGIWVTRKPSDRYEPRKEADE